MRRLLVSAHFLDSIRRVSLFHLPIWRLATAQVSSRPRTLGLLLSGTVLLAGFSGCAKVQDEGPGNGGSGGSQRGAGGGGGTLQRNGNGDPFVPPTACNGMCTDFPADPVFDTGTSAGDAGSFGGNASTGTMPCISEPEDGSMFPNN